MKIAEENSEENIAALTAQLTQAQELNQTFASILNHDLRSPLAAIMMWAEVLTLRAADEQTAATALRIRDSGKRMAQLITLLLDMAQARDGRLKLALAPTDLAQIVRQQVDQLDPARRERVKLELSGDHAGVWDGERLGQIVGNLLGNAFAHGAVGATVALRLDGNDPQQVHCEVDSVGAIPAEILPHVFTPFHPSRAKERRTGLGISLYLSRELAALHGGTLELRSANDATRVAFKLPRGAEQAQGT